MKRKMAGAAAAAVAAMVLSAAGAGAEDLTIVSKVTVGKGAGRPSTQYISSGKVKTSDGERDTIMEFATGRMLMVDHKKKEYFETSQAEMAQFLSQLDAQLQGNPMMEKILGKVGEVTVQKGTGGRKIAGYDTERYTLTMGENLTYDLWVAPALPAPQQYFEASKAPYAMMGPMGKRFEKIFDEMKKIKGFPLATSIDSKMMMFKQQVLTEATEVKKGPIPASAFEVPAGYKKKQSPFAKKQ